MEEILNKKIAQKLMQMKGELRGLAIKDDAEFILKNQGKEGLEKLERKLAEVGVPIKYGEIRSTDFYPIGLEPLTLLAIKKLFNNY